MTVEMIGGVELHQNVYLRASVSADGSRVSIVFPHDFVDDEVAVTEDQYGRHRIVFDPPYEGKKITGFVDADGVKRGKVEVSALSFAVGAKLIPGKTGTWNAKEREFDLLIGQLISNLAEPDRKAPLVAVKDVPLMRQVVVEKPITVEAALKFLNEWAEKEGATLGVEGNKLYAEVKKRWG